MAFTSFKISPPILAHRGASAYAPENTLAAFKKAKELGAAWVEFDVMLSADGEVVVIHDESLERTTNGKGRVCDHDYRYLKTLDAGSWFNPQFAGEKIPSLKEVLRFLADEELNANIELKALAGQEEETVRAVLAVLAEHWPAQKAPPLLSSFSIKILKILRQHSSTCLLGLLMDEFLPNWRELVADLQCASINLNHQLLNPESLSLYKIFPGFILSYTVNDRKRASDLISWGVAAVFTDCPDRILDHLLRKP